jgi:hypothetical protein
MANSRHAIGCDVMSPLMRAPIVPVHSIVRVWKPECSSPYANVQATRAVSGEGNMILLGSIVLVAGVAVWMVHAVRAVEAAPGFGPDDMQAERQVDFSGFVDIVRVMR